MNTSNKSQTSKDSISCSQIDSCSELAEFKVLVNSLIASNNELKEKIEKSDARIEKLEKSNDNLKQEVEILKSASQKTSIAASCQELADRGTSENGIYEIKPNLDIEPFTVRYKLHF